MANKKYEEASIQAIADVIRDKTGTEDTYKVSDMASGVNEVYEAGYKSFMDTYMNNLGDGVKAFSGTGWNPVTFYPTRDFNAASEMLASRLEECGVKIKSLYPVCTFMYAHVTRVPELDASAYYTTMFDRTFDDARFLVTIDKLILGNRTTAGTFGNTFRGCTALKNIIIEGVIPNSISFSSSPLTVESMKSIISCLKDYSGTESEHTYTITFTSACKTSLEAEGATAEYTQEDGTTINCTWLELIGYKKWLC